MNSASESNVSQKRPRKTLRIISCVIAIVVVAAGVGFFVWHEKPSFCGAICHTPMDAYYETYNNESSDKYGNLLDETSAAGMMVVSHKAEGYGCLDCHEPSMSQQISEGIAWISGGYSIAGKSEEGVAYLESRSLNDLMKPVGKEGWQMCLNDACHADLTIDTLASVTADLGSERNPHAFQHNTPECSDCHKAHSQSVNLCSQCHSDAPIPSGWLTIAEEKQLANK